MTPLTNSTLTCCVQRFGGSRFAAGRELIETVLLIFQPVLHVIERGLKKVAFALHGIPIGRPY
jgi:hypothetical protein